MPEEPFPEAVTQKPTPEPQEMRKAPPLIAERPGWTCLPDPEQGGWNCTRTGPGPQAEAVDRTEERPGPLLADTFSAPEERLFRDMLEALPQDPWIAYCAGRPAGLPFRPIGPRERAEAPLTIDADYGEVIEEEMATFIGNVEMERADQMLSSDFLFYDSVADIANARGNVRYQEEGIALAGDSAFLKLQKDQGRLRDTLFILETVPARGTSDLVHIESKTLTRYQNIAYTTCPPGNQDWILHAKNLKINKETGRGAAKHAWLEFMHVPFLYTPYISFPIDDRRKSGLLTPSFSNSDVNGIDVTTPYYWNIAPNYDATFSPRVLSRRGVLLGGEFRYLTRATNGLIALEYLPHDAVRGEARGQVAVFNNTRFTPRLNGFLDINLVSDDDYLDELGNTLDFSNTRHVRSQALLSYARPGMFLGSRLDYYQTIDPTIEDIDKPYRRLPQIMFNLNRSLGVGTAHLDWRNEYVYFQRSGSVDAQRLNLRPSIAIPFETAATFLIPRLSLQHTQYWLSNQAPGEPNTIDRTVPIFSVDGGVFLERGMTMADRRFLHTLEPRAFYLYIPHVNQDEIPLFDTALLDFNFLQLFRENRFSGADLIGDANQLSLALTSRIIEPLSGRERFRASVGQIVFFSDREITETTFQRNRCKTVPSNGCRTVPASRRETDPVSNLIGEFEALITDRLSFRSTLQWDPNDSEIDRGHVLFQYKNTRDRLLNLGYRFRRDQIHLVDGSFRWPLAMGLYAVGRLQYSVRDDLVLESFLGLEKETCCWRFRIIGRRFVNDVDVRANRVDVMTNNAIFLQLELKGLTSFGDRVDRFLERSIRGYRLLEY